MTTRPKAVIESRNGEKLSPITIAKNVLTDDGQNLHDILSDRKEDMMTPTIENSSSMFKVGQGDNVDYSENVVDGAYESCVFKGKSLVNAMTKEIDTTWNLNLTNWNIVSTSPSDFILKPNTTYSVIVYVTEKTCSDRDDLFWVGDIDGGKNKITHDIVRKNVSLGTNVFVINTVSDFSNLPSTNGGIGFQGSKLVEGTLKWKVIVLEGDWTDKEVPPYFKGICDCKSPILSNVGKNLFNINNHTESQWSFSNGYPYEQNTSYGDRLKILGDEIHFSTDGGTLNKGVGYYIPLCKNKNYTFRINKKDGNGNYCVKLFLIHSSEYPLKQAIQQYSKFGINNETITSSLKANFNSANYDMCAIYIGGGWENGTQTTRSYVFNNISLTESNQQVEPYKSNITTFNQKDGKTIVLRSLPNGVCDTLNVETGEHVQRIGEIVLNGNNDITLSISGSSNNYPNITRVWLRSGELNNLKENVVGNIICNKLPNIGANGDYEKISVSNGIDIHIATSKLSEETPNAVKQYLLQNPIEIQYELATPVVTTIDVQGFPYAYTNGHVQLSSGSIEQSLTPKVEYSVVTNRSGQIRSNQKMVERHQKQLDHLQAMVLTNLVNTQYEQALTNLKYDLKNVREEVK